MLINEVDIARWNQAILIDRYFRLPKQLDSFIMGIYLSQLTGAMPGAVRKSKSPRYSGILQ